MSLINIYSQDKNLISIIKNFARDGYKFYFYDFDEKIDTENNIFIIKNFPEKINEHAKYILLTDRPCDIQEKYLEILYDIWPETFTPNLAKFLFMKLRANIQSEKKYQKRLLEMAHQDYLTGLATRWYLQEYVQNNQHEENITCIYFDLDNFKYVNDTYGHQAGDRALAATAEMMQREFSDGVTARMGGDEFMVVLPGERTLEEVESKVNSFMKNLTDYYQTTKTMKKISVSAGIAQKSNGSKKSIDTLIHESDTALYAAKKSGKNCCKIYEG